MNKIIVRLLKRYDDADIELSLRAKLAFKSIVMVGLAFCITLLYTGYINGFDTPRSYICLTGFLSLLAAFHFLVKGSYDIAVHIIFLSGFSSLWTIMFLVPVDPLLAKMDTIVLVMLLMSAMPLLFYRSWMSIKLYFSANLIAFILFLLHIRRARVLTSRELLDYFFDNTTAMIFGFVISMNVVRIYLHILKSLKTELEERKQAEEQRSKLEAKLRQTRKMEAVGTLAGGIAHDFNNILSGIFGYCQLARINLNAPEKAMKHIGRIEKGAQRAADLTQQILTYSRQGDYQKQPLDLSIEIRQAIKLLRPSIPATIGIKPEIDTKKKGLADPIKIHQVIMNLCTNASHAMRETGGEMAVSLTDVEITDPGFFKEKQIASGDYLRLEVSDTGHGMDEKTLQKAFDPYFSTKEKGDGTGLGLAIVQAIVEEHQGVLEVDTKVGKGTRFRLYFPAVRPVPPA